MSNEWNENAEDIENEFLGLRSISGEVLEFLVLLGRINTETAFSTMELLAERRESIGLVPTAPATVVAEVMIHALHELWVNPDEAITITAKLASVSEATALELLV